MIGSRGGGGERDHESSLSLSEAILLYQLFKWKGDMRMKR